MSHVPQTLINAVFFEKRVDRGGEEPVDDLASILLIQSSGICGTRGSAPLTLKHDACAAHIGPRD